MKISTVKKKVKMDSASKKRIVEYVQFLQKGRTMIARFRLPVNEDKAYELLLAAVIAEVQFRHRKFVYNEREFGIRIALIKYCKINFHS